MSFRDTFSPRVLAVSVLIMVSASSFLLGFFVGKIGRGPEAPAVVSEETAVPYKEETSEPPEGLTRSAEGLTSPLESALPEELPREADASLSKKEKASRNEGKPSREAPATKKEGGSAPKKEGATGPHSVQAGAFKARKDAEALRGRLASQGYSAYIIEAGGVYKVRAGKFKAKKEAEVFALRLKKAEGLSAFVTTD